MSEIPPIGSTGPPAAGRPSQPAKSTPETAGPGRDRDQVELSHTAQLLSRIHELPDMRQDLIDRIREQIQSGTYETPEKIEQAIQKLVEEEGLG